MHLDAATQAVRQVIQAVLRRPPPGANWLLNVNLPNTPQAPSLPRRVTRLGRRHASQPVIRQQSPRGDTLYWIGAAGDARECGEGTDFHAVAQGQISITPLQIDLTDHHGLTYWAQAMAGLQGGR